jgi:hypothetical protein
VVPGRVEPPTPVFSELIFPVFPTTSRVAVGLLNTGKKYLENTSNTDGPWVIAVGDSIAVCEPRRLRVPVWVFGGGSSLFLLIMVGMWIFQQLSEVQ